MRPPIAAHADALPGAGSDVDPDLDSIADLDAEDDAGDGSGPTAQAAIGEDAVKARLAEEIGRIVRERGLTRVQASALVRMPRPKLSNVLRGQLRGVSNARLIDCLIRLGSDVRIVVSPGSGDGSAAGRLSVRIETGPPARPAGERASPAR